MESLKEMEETTIDWNAFEHGQELNAVRRLYAEGKMNLIPSVIVNMTREKEAEIQKMVDSQGVSMLQSESAVAREFREEEARLGRFPISTPEEEAHWQKKFDEEKATRDRKAKATVEKKDGETVQTPPKLSEITTSDKPKCEVCGREFGNKGLLTMHKKTHDSIARNQPAVNV